MKERNKFLLRLAALIPVLVLVWLAIGAARDPYRQTTEQFKQDRAALAAAAQAVLAQGSAKGIQPPQGWEVAYYDSGVPTVEFELGGAGFGSSTSYWGVNYVPDDRPVGFQGSPWGHWRPQGNGRIWQEPEGDNRCYVERLDTGWYYYKMDF